MSMTSRAAATLLLMQIVMVCPMLLTPVTYMSGGSDKHPLYGQMRAQFQANKDRVLKILEEREWYRTFLEMLKKELRKSGDDEHLIRAARLTMHLIDPTRIRRSAGDEPTPAVPRLPAKENSKVEVTAELKVDGKVRLNVTKNAESIRMGSSNEIIKADIGNTEFLLSMQFTKKDIMQDEDTTPQPPSPPSGASAAAGPAPASTEGPPLPSTRPRAPATGSSATTGAASAGGSAMNESTKFGPSWLGDYSQVQSQCTDKNYCLFGGTCVYYAIIDMQLCNCRKGYKGNRCELYDIHEVLSTLDSAHKRHVIGNGPIKHEEHMDVLSVVESTALYLLHIPSSYPSEQALQLMESLFRT